MTYVQTSIHLLVDFHVHDEGTIKLADLDPVTRSTFLARCGEALHGSRPADFADLHASKAFRPFLGLEAGTNRPSLSDVQSALSNALVEYNEAGFGLKFDPNLGGGASQLAVVVPPTCVQLIWVVDHWETRINHNLSLLAGAAPAQTLPDGRVLTGAYRVALFHS